MLAAVEAGAIRNLFGFFFLVVELSISLMPSFRPASDCFFLFNTLFVFCTSSVSSTFPPSLLKRENLESSLAIKVSPPIGDDDDGPRVASWSLFLVVIVVVVVGGKAAAAEFTDG